MGIKLIKVGKKLLHHPALQRGHEAVQVINDLFLGCLEVMCNYLLFVHFIVLGFIKVFSGQDIFQDVAGAFAVYILHCARQLDIGALQHFLKAVELPAALPDETFAIAHKLPELPLVFCGNIACLKEPMLKEIGNPFSVLHIRLPAGDSLHMAGIYHHCVQIG